MRSTLNRLLNNNAEISISAAKAFADWPGLENVTLRFINFVSPWLMIGEDTLADKTLREALKQYEEARNNGYEAAHYQFFERLARSADDLAAVRVSVLNDEEQWEVWNYDEPLMRFLSNRKRSSIQIRVREKPVSTGPVMIKLLAAVSPTNELQMAGLDLARMFQAREVR